MICIPYNEELNVELSSTEAHPSTFLHPTAGANMCTLMWRHIAIFSNITPSERRDTAVTRKMGRGGDKK